MPVALHGTGVSPGIALGPARLLQRGRLDIPHYVLPPHLVDEEVERFITALEAARAQLRAVRNQIPGGTAADITAFIDTHLLMLEDATLATVPIELILREGCNAEWALHLQQEALTKVFDQMDDAYLRTRRDDVEHAILRVQQILLNQDQREAAIAAEAQGGRIIVTDDLSPDELMLLHQHDVAAIVTEHGGPMSHVAILARSLGIPAVVGAHNAWQYIREGEPVVVDGRQGVLLAGLDAAGTTFYRARQQQERRARSELRRLKDTPAITRDGVPITLFANIELPEDIQAARRVGAAGIGLYRTEFLYMNRSAPPDEEEQYRAYSKVVKAMKGMPVTIRTLDLGADKTADGVGSERSAANPALGLRAVRLCLREPELFRPQLRAILRASQHGPVRLLIPMLSTVQEIRQVRELIDETREDLRRCRQPYAGDIAVGGMIEVPAAAVCAEDFARRLDFLSIGTNDLIQYTLAADRLDEALGHLYQPLHPAVLRLIHTTLRAGQDAGIPVTMCGEMAGDPQLTRLLLGLGLTEFSVPPPALLEVKRIITGSELEPLRRAARKILRQDDMEQSMRLLAELNAAD
ncbi:phosphoenolpyruvate--protein phosphotransferase [Sulfurivermis fontis]|uniref:phosphoenolpyruvate--protein phosphotransferase n=1 Tax=Sulfurivermis fontis TaxID=1972068 RepID=UPI000FD801B6|nr:phosphoenolpyruvate--protein phosphotransferase [Sulfurivermis fontis]